MRRRTLGRWRSLFSWNRRAPHFASPAAKPMSLNAERLGMNIAKSHSIVF